jgi:hypothetical protein
LCSSTNIPRVLKSRRMRWMCMQNVWKRWEMHETFCLEDLKGRATRIDVGVDGRKILDWILRKWGAKVWTGFIWLRIGTIGKLSWIGSWAFGFHKKKVRSLD